MREIKWKEKNRLLDTVTVKKFKEIDVKSFEQRYKELLQEFQTKLIRAIKRKEDANKNNYNLKERGVE